MTAQVFLTKELHNIAVALKHHLSEKNEGPLVFLFDEIDLSEILPYLVCEKIFYFKSKYKDFSFLGLGHSSTVLACDLTEHLEKNPHHFLIAAFLFEENPNATEFILPEWSFISGMGKTQLTVRHSSQYRTLSSPNLFFHLNSSLSSPDLFIPPWQSYEEFPEHDQWSEMIHKCDLLFENGDLEKIVLSRKKIFDYDENIDPLLFFNTVLKNNNKANSSYAVFYQTSFDRAFMSLTPEKLFSLEGDHFESISLAASAPRGKTPEEDLEFEKLLGSCDKLAREHNLVTEEIIKKIKPLSKTISVSGLETMKLPYIQHRSIPITAELKNHSQVLDLVHLLHPTPAIGGLPSDKAQKEILNLEPYTRDSYAAPIGVISFGFSELAVGIRSALIEKTKVTLFGGAGIIKGSVAEEEWIETGIKMNPFLKVVNCE